MFCVVCGLMKKPIGRSAPMYGRRFCDHECEGYYKEPLAGSLWHGESEAESGFAAIGGVETEEKEKT